MSADFSAALALLRNNKDKLNLSADVNRDEYIGRLDGILGSLNETASPRMEALKVTISGFQSLITVAMGFLAVIGSIVQYFLSIGLPWNDYAVLCLYGSALAAVLSVMFGKWATGAAIKAIKNPNIGVSKWSNGVEKWKFWQMISVLLLVVLFAVSVVIFSSNFSPESIVNDTSFTARSWKSLTLKYGTAVVQTGDAGKEDNASLTIKFR